MEKPIVVLEKPADRTTFATQRPKRARLALQFSCLALLVLLSWDQLKAQSAVSAPPGHDAVFPNQRHQIGHGAQGDEVEIIAQFDPQRRRARWAPAPMRLSLVQAGASLTEELHAYGRRLERCSVSPLHIAP